VITAPGAIQPGRKELESISEPDSFHFRKPYFLTKATYDNKYNRRAKTILYFARNHGIKLAGDREADEFATFFNTELNKTQVCDTANALIAEGGEGFYTGLMTVKSFGKLNDPRPKLKNSTLPVLIMKGQCDNQPWGYTTEFLELFTNHQFVVVPDAGHNIFIEQPGAYQKTIRDFLR
jgi:proline iminopeptidase